MCTDVLIRYLGEEEEDSESSRESRSRALLAKLQEQVKAREQLSISNTADEEQKKRKPEEPDTEEVHRENERIADDITSSAKKKKKLKRLSTENESVNTGNAAFLRCLIVFKLI